METQTPRAASVDDHVVAVRMEEDVAVIAVQVECFSDHDAERVAGACLEIAARRGCARQAVSLGLVREITCAGLRALVQVSNTLDASGGRLVVFGASPQVRQIVRRTGLRLQMAQGAREAVQLARADAAPRRGLLTVFGRTRAA